MGDRSLHDNTEISPQLHQEAVTGSVCTSVRVHLSSTPVWLHRSLRSGQSDQTPKPAAGVSNFPLTFLQEVVLGVHG